MLGNRAVFIGAMTICSISLWACGRVDEIQHIHGTEDNISKEQQLVDLMEEKLLTFESGGSITATAHWRRQGTTSTFIGKRKRDWSHTRVGMEQKLTV